MIEQHHFLLQVAQRVRALRLDRAWSQEELAKRAGIALPTYKLFEKTGDIALDRLHRISIALRRDRELEALFEPPPIRSIDELAAPQTSVMRKRGHTLK
jgi:transcriptional regulator with XRE-family HTH domain